MFRTTLCPEKDDPSFFMESMCYYIYCSSLFLPFSFQTGLGLRVFKSKITKEQEKLVFCLYNAESTTVSFQLWLTFNIVFQMHCIVVRHLYNLLGDPQIGLVPYTI